MTLLIVYLVLAVGVSFLCSLLEAGLLTVPRGYIAHLVEQGQAAGRRLESMKRDIERPLSAILTLNTIAHTVGAAGVGAQSAVVFGKAWVGVSSAVLTLLVLVLSEIIPKTLGARHAKRLAPFTAFTVRWLMIICHPLVVALEWVNKLVAGPQHHAQLTRDEFRALARLGRDEGALDASESRVMLNVIALREIEVRQIMTPRKMLFALDQTKTVGQAMAIDGPLTYARIPVYDGDIDHITGKVTRFEVHTAEREGHADTALSDLARPIQVIPEHASVADALEQLLARSAHMFHVVDEFGGTAGVVTLEDAMETLLGVEIVDETDVAVDLQAVARQTHLRQQVRAAQNVELNASKDKPADGTSE